MSRKPDPFTSPRRRLARGQEHVRRLEKRIQTFLKKEPHKSIAETDADGTTVHALKFTRDFPESWADGAVEALEAFRSALDQTGYAAAVLGGVTEPKNAYFPMADTATDLDGVTRGRCRDLPDEIKALFRSFDAHEGGNYALWALNKLCNANKHRLLVPVGIAGAGFTIKQAVLSGGSMGMPLWDREKNQIEFARIGPGGQFQYDGQISFFIAFDDFNGVKGGPAVGILNAMAGEVRRVLRATEAECHRIGIL